VIGLLSATVRAFPDAPAFVAPGRDAMTYTSLAAQLDTAARALSNLGFGARSRIAVALPEGAESAVCVLAVCCFATCAPLNPALEEATLARLLGSMRIDAMIVLEGQESNASRAARRAGIEIIELRPTPSAAAGAFEFVAAPSHPATTVERPGLDDPALLMSTSGTTGTPKIVPGTQRRLAEGARFRIELTALTARDRCLLLVPLYSNVGLRRCVLPCLAIGGSVACVGAFDPARIIDWLVDLRPTHYMASAAAQVAILEAVERHGARVDHELRFALSGGAPLPASVTERLEHALGVPVLQGYGITETGNIAQTPLPPRRTPPRSVGLPSNVDILIVDAAGRALGVDEPGEILVRGPEVFDGYENDPVATAAAFRDGWFRTGDIGRIDRDGFLFLSGRNKDVINRGGTKVAPTDVEDALARHPQVVEAAAFAVSHATLGEDIAAAVVLRHPATASEGELRDFVRASLPPFKVPTRIAIVDSLPKGSFDKVMRAEVARIAEAEMRTEYRAPRGPVETAIVGAFGEVLGLERVGVFDNFFQLGGDSLRASRVVARLQDILGRAIALDALFREPTAEGLAGAIGANAAGANAMTTGSISPRPRRAATRTTVRFPIRKWRERR
jgi:acyl-CoA synthetase (AMP-forming)/AMP-acid ligase II